MDNKTAAILLTSLLERVEREQTIGVVSSLERQALQLALGALGDTGRPAPAATQPPVRPAPTPAAAGIDAKAGQATPAAVPPPAHPPAPPAPPKLPAVTLVLNSLDSGTPTDSDLLMCLDFGTAMSKAFATVSPDEYLELELGTAAGQSGYTLPSSVFIGDDGKAYFGFEAIDHSQDLVDSGRERLDSIKGWLSLRREGNLDGQSCVLQPALNPTPYRLTQGDLIRFYLAYLTDMACIAVSGYQIQDKIIGRYPKRRFARPCWPDEAQALWAEQLMRSMLAEAQILADTFSGKWAGGIDVSELKAAVEQIKLLGKRPDYLIAEGVPEPVAVAAGAIADSQNLRSAFMVVDVGAGTTDFGLFVSTRMTGVEGDLPKVFQVPASIQGLMQAGDKVDGMLRAFIARKESVDAADNSGRMILADLGRRIRGLKETLFKTGKLEYALADGTVGQVTLEQFLADEAVKRFSTAVETGFKKALGALDDTWLQWLARDGVRLNVVLTGGSAALPMMAALGHDVVEVKGFRILRQPVDPRPDWMTGVSKELLDVYRQLAVAIGGSAENLPETLTAPTVFAGAGGPSRYVAGQFQISGT
jgi:molecular chaperone HscA